MGFEVDRAATPGYHRLREEYNLYPHIWMGSVKILGFLDEHNYQYLKSECSHALATFL